jgi:hypothetical protein
MGSRLRNIFVCLALAFIVSGCGSSSGNAVQQPTPTISHYAATLSALNASGVSGTVEMTLSGDEMDVTILLIGLVPNQQHMQHIHGAHETHATCPTATSANQDGIITLATGTPAYGPVALPFEPTPTADASGNITWSRHLTLASYEIYDMTTLTQHVVLIHGMTYKGVYDQTLPVACGPIKAA